MINYVSVVASIDLLVLLATIIGYCFLLCLTILMRNKIHIP